MKNTCPCTSGLKYAECCGPYHRGEREAPTPEALMRSRFSAFARADAAYLWRTLHQDHDDRQRPEADMLALLREQAQAHKYMGLTIFDAQDNRVVFLARVFRKGRDVSFLELSRFAHDGVGWRYLSGEARPPCKADGEGLTVAEFGHVT